MTANVLEHRRAKAFAEALEAHQAEHRGGTRPTDGPAGRGDAMAGLLGMADSLGAMPGPELDHEVRSVQRAQLMAAFEQAFSGRGAGLTVPRQRGGRAHRAVPRGRWSRRFAIGGLVAGIAVGSFAGVAAASAGALPGDSLYGMKRGLEGLQLDLAGSDSERGALLLDQASNRLGEAQGLMGRGGSPTALSPDTVEQVRRALDDMHAEAIKGRDLLRSVYRSNGSLDPMRRLAGFAAGEDGRWTELQGRLPVQLTQEAGRVDRLFDDISEDVAPLRLTQQPGQGGGSGSGTSGDRTQSTAAESDPGSGPATSGGGPAGAPGRSPRPAAARAAAPLRAPRRATRRPRSAAWSTGWPTASPGPSPRRARTPPRAGRRPRRPGHRARGPAASRASTSRR